MQVDGGWFEVRRIESVAGRFVYYLGPWDESFPLREPRELSAEACRREHARQREHQQREKASTLLTLASPFVGLLPAADQERLERELGLPAVRTTLVSALAFGIVAMLLAGPGLAVAFIPRFASANPGLAWTGRVLPLSLIVLVDSLLRVMHADAKMRFKLILGADDPATAAAQWDALRPMLDLHERLEDEFLSTVMEASRRTTGSTITTLETRPRRIIAIAVRKSRRPNGMR